MEPWVLAANGTVWGVARPVCYGSVQAHGLLGPLCPGGLGGRVSRLGGRVKERMDSVRSSALTFSRKLLNCAGRSLLRCTFWMFAHEGDSERLGTEIQKAKSITHG